MASHMESLAALMIFSMLSSYLKKGRANMKGFICIPYMK